jgi:hypothetical protein
MVSNAYGKLEIKPTSINNIIGHFIDYTLETEKLRNLNEKDLKYYWNIKK